MQSLYQFLKTTVIGGLVVLVPVAVCAYIISAVIKKVLSILGPIAKLLHVESVGGIAIVEVAAVLVVIAACFLFGLLVRTAAGQTLGSWFEEKVLNLLPGYQLMKKVSLQFAGGSEAAHWTPVLVKVGESRQIGFLVEEHSSGEVTVFIPAAPAVSLGAVHMVKAELVEKLDVSMRKVVDCITQLGIGSSKLTSMSQAPASPEKNNG
ncbi:MAG: DUF502 domain-containing protein [Desulfomonilaceae bacterium]